MAVVQRICLVVENADTKRPNLMVQREKGCAAAHPFSKLYMHAAECQFTKNGEHHEAKTIR